MATPRFNPYRNWLGLAETPGNYYELLELPVLEPDTDQVRVAATRALSTLRSIKPGRRQGRWKALLDQLESARDCLLSAEQKRRYDDRLRQKLGVSDSSRPATPSDVTPASFDVANSPDPRTDPMAPVEFVRSISARTGDAASRPSTVESKRLDPFPSDSRPSDSRPSDSRPSDSRSPDTGEDFDVPVATASMEPRRRFVARRKRTSPPASLTFVYAVMAICFVGLFAVFVAVMQWRILPAHQDRQQRLAALPQSASDLPLPTDDQVTGPPARESPVTSPPPVAADTPQPDSAAAPMVPPTSASKGPPVIVRSPSPVVELSQATRNEIDRHLGQAYSAMAQHHWETAETSLSEARTLAIQSELTGRVERFETLNDYAQQYYQAFSESLEGLAGSELMLEGNHVMVVEANRDHLVIRMQGENRRFSHDDLPTEIIMMIADRWFDQRAATTRAFRGAFMLVTGHFTPEEVRQEWRQAERDGAKVDDLTQILDDLEAIGAEQK